jgi:hypothetical protein
MRALEQLHALDAKPARTKRFTGHPGSDRRATASDWHPEPADSGWRLLDAHDTVGLRQRWAAKLAGPGPWRAERTD